MEYKELIDALSDDQEYYNGIGKQYLSSSDIGTLLRNPRLFGVPRKDDKSLSEGRLFHTMILEPEKEINIPICDSGSRNTKAYKEFIADKGVEFCLLKKEYDKVVSWVDTIKSNFDFYRMIYAEGNRFEVPEVKDFKDTMWKGKADIVGETMLYDLKTTADINKFKYSASAYNYDSQCFIYQKLFNKPLKFLVIDKESLQLGIFEPSDDFLRRGEEKVDKAIEIFNKFFSGKRTQDIRDYYIEETL